VWFVFHADIPKSLMRSRIGGLVHGEITQRSRALFSRQYDPANFTYPDPYYTAIAQWLEQNDAAVVAGSFMPDWFFTLAFPR